MTAYASVVLDVDSTVSGVEGIDWLGKRRGEDVRAEIVALTDKAMRGEVALESVYGRRLAMIQPTVEDIEALSRAYIQQIAPGCADAIQRFRREAVRVVLVSGGIRQAILPLAAQLGINASDVHAVDVRFGVNGMYAAFDHSSPLATSAGKHEVVEGCRLPRRIVGMGDGSTDVAMKGAVDTFAAFTGFAARESVVKHADVVLQSFAELATLVLG